MSVTAIIAAGGKGRRMNAPVAKQFLEIQGKPIIFHTLKKFDEHNLIDNIVLVVPEESVDFVAREIVNRNALKKVTEIVPGGNTRQESVKNGLERLPPETEIILVHDAVRPFVPNSVINETIKVAKSFGAAVVAVPVKDTVKIVEGHKIISTPPRNTIWLAQTPQAFQKDILLKAYRRAYEDNFSGTDDASLVERQGCEVRIVEGSYTNIKITTLEDLEVASLILSRDLQKE